MQPSMSDQTTRDLNQPLEQLSRNELTDLVKLYSKLYITLDGFWYYAMQNQAGDDKALEHDLWVWEKVRSREFKGLMEMLQPDRRDLSAFLGMLVLTPWFNLGKYHIEFKGPNRAVLTIDHCPTLLVLEQEGQGREQNICNVVDADYFREFTRAYNPDLRVEPISIPPRADKSGICCAWEYYLPEDSGQ